MHDAIKPFFERIEDSIQRMDGSFTDLPIEALDWTPDPAINSMTVLIVHTTSALRYWMGSMIGGQPSHRVRSEEFEAENYSKQALKQMLSEVLALSRSVLEDLTLERFVEKVYSPVHNDYFTIAFSLAHALEHTALHVGHMEVTRELWEQFDWERKGPPDNGD